MLSERGQAVFDRLVANHTNQEYDNSHLNDARQALNLTVPLCPDYWKPPNSDIKWTLEQTKNTSYSKGYTYLSKGTSEDTFDFFYVEKINDIENMSHTIIALNGTIDVAPLRSLSTVRNYEQQKRDDNMLGENEHLKPIDVLKYCSHLDNYEAFVKLTDKFRSYSYERPSLTNCIVSEKELNIMLKSVGIEKEKEKTKSSLERE